MGAKKQKFLIIMKILSVEIPVKEIVQRMSIEWRRGDKKSETRTTFQLEPSKPLAFVNETFSKSSVFYLNNKTGKYFKKLAVIRVKGYMESSENKERIIGELELDISNFVGVAGDTKTL